MVESLLRKAAMKTPRERKFESDQQSAVSE
jgi:hypothetical protein